MDGKAFLLARSDGECRKVGSFKDCLEFLLDYENRGKANFWYNLEYDFRGIVKHLDPAAWDTLARENRLEFDDLKISYIPGKKFSLRDGSHTVCFYDLAQFYMMSLDQASKEYLGEKKLDVDAERMNDPNFVESNWEKIVAYCKRDAWLCGKLAEHLRELYRKAGVSFSRPVSIASLGMKHAAFKAKLGKYFPKPWQRFAFRAYRGGRFELFKRGTFDKAYSYDLNSAYPSVIKELPRLKDGYWQHSRSVMDGAELGYIRCKVAVRDSWIGALALKDRSLIKFPRTKKREAYLTLNEFLEFEKVPSVDVECIEGWFWFPLRPSRPFSMVEDWYKRRQELKENGDDLELVYKTMMNSIYGKFVEQRKKLVRQEKPSDKTVYWRIEDGKAVPYRYGYVTGNYFCPVYAAKLTADCRLKLLKMGLRRRSRIIAMHTDSIFTERKLPENSTKMGRWKLEKEGRLVIFATGVYSFDVGDRILTKARGFRFQKGLNLFEELEKESDKKKLSLPVRHAVSLLEVLHHSKKYDLEDMNKILYMAKCADPNGDEKREWARDFEDCGEVLETVHESKTLRI